MLFPSPATAYVDNIILVDVGTQTVSTNGSGAMLLRLSTSGFRDCKQNADQTGKGPQQNGEALC